MEEFVFQGIPLVLPIVFVTTLVGWMGVPRKLLPLVVLVLSELAGFFYLAPGDPKMAVLVGVSLAIASVGAHSTGKNLLEHFTR